MRVLGLRCSNRDYHYVILEGTRKVPVLVNQGHAAFPKGFAKPQLLKWFLQELEDLVKRQSIEAISMRGAEGLAARGKPFVERIEIEGIVFLVGAQLGIKPVVKKVMATVAKDLGFKGKAHYVKTSLDTSLIPNYDDYPQKIQEAILAGWSELP